MNALKNFSAQNEPFFLPYQKKWILDKSRIKLMEKSRQIGMSWTTAYSLVRRHCTEGNSRDSWVSSRDELQAALFIGDCKKFAEILGVVFREIRGVDFLDSRSSNFLEFADGTRIWSLSSNPDAQAGKRGARVLDEFALHPDPQKLYSIAYPGITWGGSMEIISTHRGSENFFNKLVEEARFGGNPKKISLHRVTLSDALDQGFLKKLKASLPEDHEVLSMDDAEYFDFIKNSCADRESFLQEYMCQPFDDASSFISHNILKNCLYKDGENWQSFSEYEGIPLYLGVDVARSRDLSVFWLLEKISDTLYTRAVKVFKDIPFSEQEAELHKFLRLPNLRRVAIDKSGLGLQFAERAAERYGATRVEGVSFTSGAKEMLAYPLRSLFEDARVRIPDEPDIRSDIRSIKRTSTSSGGIRISAERNADGHADRFWALALAAHAARESFYEKRVDFIPVQKRDFIW